MYKTGKLPLAAALGVCAVFFGLEGAAQRNWKTEEREPIHRTFANDKSLDVDDVNGTIKVTGDNGNTIRVEGERIIRAVDQQALDRAKRETTLDVNEKDGVAQLYVNGPFRGNNRAGDDHGFHIHSGDQDYEVTYNFDIRVPRATALRLANVNGDVNTDQASGKFEIREVNGRVTMTAAAGSGTVRNVNGGIHVAFRENPNAESGFRTVNGSVDATFAPNLAADLRLKTLNGQAYTDFETAAVAGNASAPGERRNGRFAYKPNHTSTVRVGAGGPELSFETVNGDIRILKEAVK